MTRPTVVNVSGHMIDAPGRSTVRFPSSEEPRVTADIRHVFDSWNVGPGTTVISGGARGTDLICAEQALELGADVVLCLAQSVDRFVEESVALADTEWTERFHAVRSAATEVTILPEQHRAAHDNIYAATNAWMIDVGRSRAMSATEPRALVVWNGREGDGSGGTRDFCRLLDLTAPDDDRVAVIDPTPRRYEHRQRRAPTPKRMLALDGGGVRSVISLEILTRLERQLREQTGDPDHRLADFFDFVGGTSTGAIIATALALGDHSASELLERYEALQSAVFGKRPRFRRLRSLQRHRRFDEQLDAIIGGGRTLGDPDFEALVLLVLHDARRDAVWPLTNNTAARSNRADRYLLDRPDRTLDLSLTELVRGSAAGPTVFAPSEILVGETTRVFQDGGITPFNNPAFLMYIMATAPEHHLEWDQGAENLLVVSVGTGASTAEHPDTSSGTASAWINLANLPAVYMNGASAAQDQICRTVGRCRDATEPESDSRRRDDGDAAFTYVRYEADLSEAGLRRQGITSARQRERIRRLDAVDQTDQLRIIGRSAADGVDVAEHFAGFLHRAPA